MKTKAIKAIQLGLFCTSLVSSLHANQFQCPDNTSLVRTGDTIEHVIETCGQPKKVLQDEGAQKRVEEWPRPVNAPNVPFYSGVYPYPFASPYFSPLPSIAPPPPKYNEHFSVIITRLQYHPQHFLPITTFIFHDGTLYEKVTEAAVANAR